MDGDGICRDVRNNCFRQYFGPIDISARCSDSWGQDPLRGVTMNKRRFSLSSIELWPCSPPIQLSHVLHVLGDVNASFVMSSTAETIVHDPYLLEARQFLNHPFERAAMLTIRTCCSAIDVAIRHTRQDATLSTLTGSIWHFHVIPLFGSVTTSVDANTNSFAVWHETQSSL